MSYDYLKDDPELWDAIAAEKQRQETTIELIASENIVSNAVRAAQGSVLTNKYAEGYILVTVIMVVVKMLILLKI